MTGKPLAIPLHLSLHCRFIRQVKNPEMRAGGGPFRQFQRNVGSGKLDDWEGHKEGGARGDNDLLIVIPQSSRQ